VQVRFGEEKRSCASYSTRWLIVIAALVHLAAATQEQKAQIEDIFDHVHLCDVMITEFETLPRSASIEQALDR
jgi:hypothetical protein